MKKTTKIIFLFTAIISSFNFIQALERSSGGSSTSRILAYIQGAITIGIWACLIISFFGKSGKH